MQYGGTYVYVYRGNDAAEITRFTFNRHDCNLPNASVSSDIASPQNVPLPELDCEPTGEPPYWIDGKKLTPVKCKGM